MTTPATGDDADPGAADVALMQSPGFWVVVRYAIVLGVVLAFASLGFLAAVTFGTNLWFTFPPTSAGSAAARGGWR